MGERVYFPNSSQFDEMNKHLSKIANSLSTEIDVSTWQGIQKAVRAGVAPEFIPVGTQLLVHHSVYGDHLYDVVAHDYLKSAYNENAHTMTLLCHDSIGQIQYDAAEKFYIGGLIKGTMYCFNAHGEGQWMSIPYNFVPTENIENCYLIINGDTSKPLSDCKMVAYNDDGTKIAEWEIDTGMPPEDSGGDYIFLDDSLANHTGRVVYGSNNYKESAIRQFLNSSAEAGKVWTPQTKFDMKPQWADTLDGFMRGFDEEFLACVGKVIVPCSANNIYESPDSTVVKRQPYTVADKFYLASQAEITDTFSNVVSEGSKVFPYYKGGTNADFIKYRDGSAIDWRTRSSAAGHSHQVRMLNSSGTLYHSAAKYSAECVPSFTIV